MALSPIKLPATPVHTGVEILTGAADWLAGPLGMAGPLTLADLQRMHKLITTSRPMPNIIVMSRARYNRIRSKLESWYYDS